MSADHKFSPEDGGYRCSICKRSRALCPNREPDPRKGYPVPLDERQIHAVALKLTARHLADAGWSDWEDVPLLTESEWERLAEELEVVAAEVARMARRYEGASGIDAAHIIEVVS